MVYEYFDIAGYEGLVKHEIKCFTDRPIVVRKKGSSEGLQEQLAKAWCVVTHASMVAVDAVMAGVPVVVTGPSIAKPMATEMRYIETPVFPEREPWFRSLAYAQFSQKDMRRGIVKPLLDENPEDYEHHGW